MISPSPARPPKPGCWPTAKSARRSCSRSIWNASRAWTASCAATAWCCTDKARDEAYAAQDRLDAGERLPLLGVPIAIKDDVDVAGEVTACGSARPPARGDRRRGGGAPAACRRRGHHRQNRGARADDLSVHRIADVRGHPKPVEPQAHSGREQRRQCRRGGRRAGFVGAGIRRRRLDPHPVELVRPVRPETATRPGLARAARRRLVRAERQRPDSALGAGRGVVPRCDQYGVRSRRRVRGGRHTRARQAANCLEHQGSSRRLCAVGSEQLAAVDAAGALLRELGHDVVVRDPAYPLACDLRELFAPLSARHQRRGRRAGPPRTPGATHPHHGAHGLVLLRSNGWKPCAPPRRG